MTAHRGKRSCENFKEGGLPMKLLTISALIGLVLSSAVLTLALLARGLPAAPAALAAPDDGGLSSAIPNGDVNCDGTIEISDAVYTLQFLFAGGPPPCAVAPCPRSVLPLGPTPGRFIDNADGAVSDTATGLMWQKATPSAPLGWEDAARYCEELELAGKTDWRLPNVRELESLLYLHPVEPRVDPAFVVPDDGTREYWTSTPTTPGFAYLVSFQPGRGAILARQTLQQQSYVLAVRNASTAQE
jgi:hypothetical protein